MLSTIASARATRDGGIHAVAALDFALAEALAELPAEQAQDLKRAFGHVLGEIIEHIFNPAVQAFPELNPDDREWSSIVREHSARLGARSAAGVNGSSQASNRNE